MPIRMPARALAIGTMFAAAAASLATGGCASVVTGSYGGGGEFDYGQQKVFIDSKPQGAAVTINGIDQGLTPTRVILDRRKGQDVRLTLAGYRTHEQRLSPGFNPWFLANFALIGLFPVGMVIDVITGDVQSLNPQSLRVRMIADGRGFR